MFKYLTVPFLCLAVCFGSVINLPKSNSLNEETLVPDQKVKDQKVNVDLETLVAVTIEYANDPEVVNLYTLFGTPQFKSLMYELVSLNEYKEALALLESKGHDVEFLRDVSFLESPFKSQKAIRRTGNGVSGLLEDIAAAVPAEEMKKLLENTLEANPKIAKLFETINSEEFMKVLKKLLQNPLFQQIKNILEKYGVNFENIRNKVCEMINKFYGGNINGICQ